MTATKITDEQVRTIYREYLTSPDTLACVAAQHRVSESTLSHRFRVLGLPPRFARACQSPAKLIRKPDTKSWYMNYVRYLMTMKV